MTEKAGSGVSTNIITGVNYIPFFLWWSEKAEQGAVAFSVMMSVAVRFFPFHFLMGLKHFPRPYHQEEEQKKAFSNLNSFTFVWLNVTRYLVIYGDYLHGDHKQHQSFLALKKKNLIPLTPVVDGRKF